MSTRITIAATLVAVVAAAALWYAWRESAGSMPDAPRAPEREVLYWYDPMRPDVHFDAPGRSPFMAMDLVPRYADPAPAAGTVVIDAGMVQNLGLRTSSVRRGTFWQRVDTTGRIEIDERSVAAVTVRTNGWIEDLHVRSDGEFVARNDRVAEIYAPAIATAERELALAARSASNDLLDAARVQLIALGVDPARADALAAGAAPGDRYTLRAPKSGYVMGLRVRQGDAVSADVPLFELVSHDPIWVIADVPERQSEWIRSGKSAEIRVPALPGRTFEGTVDYIYPDIEPSTRTRRVRIVLPNDSDALHPGMYADVTLFGGARRDVLLVPSEAVIRTGQRTVVVVADGAGRFRPVDVEIGAERDGDSVVLAGLGDGQSVVTSGQFLIDSEASLKGTFNRMGATAPADPAPAAHDDRHGAHGPGAHP